MQYNHIIYDNIKNVHIKAHGKVSQFKLLCTVQENATVQYVD